ncbi:hypothetical protein H2201_005149 [Coniosporium apollinis]|uniref:RING-type domain-containing protein n=1 Tax=Coniosporium apollinis TaxID=61459 RepID=A0ABQ9NXB8_9PEZI|nr:hypothetical protein H2201_005149 [Coniosporium apollinis]
MPSSPVSTRAPEPHTGALRYFLAHDLKTVQILNLDKEERSCCICTDTYGEEKPVQLPCGHIMGADCIRAWLSVKERKNKCPVCRYMLFPLEEEVWETDEVNETSHGDHPFWNAPPSSYPDVAALEGRVYPETEWSWITEAIYVRVNAAAMSATLDRLSEAAGLRQGVADFGNRETYEIMVAREAVRAHLQSLDGTSVPIGHLHEVLYKEARHAMKYARRSGFSERLSAKFRKVKGGSFDFPDGPYGFFKLMLRRIINIQRVAAAQAARQ